MSGLKNTPKNTTYVGSSHNLVPRDVYAVIELFDSFRECDYESQENLCAYLGLTPDLLLNTRDFLFKIWQELPNDSEINRSRLEALVVSAKNTPNARSLAVLLATYMSKELAPILKKYDAVVKTFVVGLAPNYGVRAMAHCLRSRKQATLTIMYQNQEVNLALKEIILPTQAGKDAPAYVLGRFPDAMRELNNQTILTYVGDRHVTAILVTRLMKKLGNDSFVIE